MVNKKAVIICSVIALILVVAIVGIQIKFWKTEYDKLGMENEENVSTNQTNITNTTNNQVDTENETNNSSENTSSNEFLGEEEEDDQTDENEAKVTNLVKKEWGENDTTVYYTIDSKTGNTYTVSVRSKTTTAQLAEYEVNIVTGDVEIK